MSDDGEPGKATHVPMELEALEALLSSYPAIYLAGVSEDTFFTMRQLLVATAFSDGSDDHCFATYLGVHRGEVRRIAALWAQRELIGLADLETAWSVLVNAAVIRPVPAWTGDCPPVTSLNNAMQELEPNSHRVVVRLANPGR